MLVAHGGYGWTVAAPVLVAVAFAALLFATAFVRLRRRGRADHARWSRAALFGLALAAVVAALVSPLDAVAEDSLLSAHMLQHVLVGDLAPALAMLALRGPIVFFVLPPAILAPLARAAPLRAAARTLLRPGVALTLWAAAVLGWHVPRAYEYALAHAWAHDLEHACFVAAGVLAWAVLVDPARRGELTRGRRIAFAVGLFLAGQLLSDALLFSQSAHYSVYAGQPDRPLGLSPLADQRLAGAVMMGEQLLTLGTCVAFLLWPYLKPQERTAAAPGVR